MWAAIESSGSVKSGKSSPAVADRTQQNRLIGLVYIPILTLSSSDHSVSWHQLGRRSKRTSLCRGEVEIEIACSGQPDNEQLPWLLFREVQKLPDLSLSLAATKAGAGQIPLSSLRKGSFSCNSSSPNPQDTRSLLLTPLAPHSSASSSSSLKRNISLDSEPEAEVNGFPLHFPPIEIETLEDISLRVSLVSVVNSGKVVSPGTLFLTNFRLIFISTVRMRRNISPKQSSEFKDIVHLSKTSSYDTAFNNIGGFVGPRSSKDIDLSLHVPISSIVHVALGSELDAEAGGNTSISDAIRIRTNDFRNMAFYFHDEDSSMETFPHTDDDGGGKLDQPGSVMRRGSLDDTAGRKNSDDSYFSAKSRRNSVIGRTDWRSSTAGGIRVPRKRNSITETRPAVEPYSTMEYYWVRLVGDSIFLVEGLDSEEGPPVQRMYRRLKFEVVALIWKTCVTAHSSSFD